MLTCLLRINNPTLNQQNRTDKCKEARQQFNGKTLIKAKVNTKQNKKGSWDRE